MVFCGTCKRAADFAMARGLVCQRPPPQPVVVDSDSISQAPPAVAPSVLEEEHAVPLVAVNVFTTIHDLAVETVIEQLYVNTELDARMSSHIFAPCAVDSNAKD